MKCIVVTPEKTVLDQEADMVVLPLYDGEYGVAPMHTPVIGRIGAGELRIKSAGESLESWYIEGGFAEVQNDIVSILTQKAVPVKNLDSAKAQSELEEVRKRPAKGEAQRSEKESALNKARAKVRVASKKK
ncbi:MAG: ATP synthase F1 subunit epsilon [Planctomycetia bacterium]|nr:ATP synthase F1 subunit epsilon [Planctomycetia bacterium]